MLGCNPEQNNNQKQTRRRSIKHYKPKTSKPDDDSENKEHKKSPTTPKNDSKKSVSKESPKKQADDDSENKDRKKSPTTPKNDSKKAKETEKEAPSKKESKKIAVRFIFLNSSEKSHIFKLNSTTKIKNLLTFISDRFKIPKKNRIKIKYKNTFDAFVEINPETTIEDIQNEIVQQFQNKKCNCLYIDIDNQSEKKKTKKTRKKKKIDDKKEEEEDKNEKEDEKVKKFKNEEEEESESLSLYTNSFDNELLIDQTKFERIKRIGSGSYGEVWLARSKITKKLYAVKIFNKIEKQMIIDEINNLEINILKTLNFPTIVRFFGFSLKNFKGEDSIMMFMKYEKNQTLGKYLQDCRTHKRMKFDNTTIQIIIMGIAAGMNYLHFHNIMHRDLKPDNILLNADNHAVIADFGLAKYYMGGNNLTQGVGTPKYQAPEIIRGDNYNLSADLYSFGIMLHEILSGLEPYKGFSLFKLQNHVIQGYRPSLENVSIKPALKELISNLFSDNIEKRPSFKKIAHWLAYDENYYLENVDVDKVVSYAKELNIK